MMTEQLPVRRLGWRLPGPAFHVGILALSVALGGVAPAADGPAVSGIPQAENDFALVVGGAAATVVYATNDARVVEIAAKLFAEDIERVTGVRPAVADSFAGVGDRIVLIGTLGGSPPVDALVAGGGLDVSAIDGEWERYRIDVVDDPFPGVSRALVVAGSDRRGTAYGVFALSEAMGVSPWYWWADVPPQTLSAVHVGATPFDSKGPSVRYRGIFLNDEDWGLQEWAEKTFESGAGEVKDIGPKTYARIFELLLRLKANHLWPAMHPSTRAFNAYAENKAVADDYAIVMGSSHAEPMLRNNVYEWYHDTDPVTGQLYSNGSWDYSVNQAGVYRYWEQRALANGRYENVYTVGKRGIHDSGMVEGSGNAQKAAWLNTIFADQRGILSNLVNAAVSRVPQIFTPYKEVLDIYDTGLVEVPDDVTLGWPDDNHGYIRRLSDDAERARGGGGGVYYHISYWGSPADYLWLCSTPPSLVWEEMTKAYAFDCRRIWVVNVGDIKPAEIVTEFFLRLAWDVDRYDAQAQSAWLTEWATREFGAERAEAIAGLLNDYYQLGYARKPEHLNWVDADPLTPSGPYPLFSHVHHGDEAARRLAEYADLVRRGNTISAALPAERRSAFFQTVLYPILGADGMTRKFLEAGRAYVASVQGRNTVAARKAASQAGEAAIQAHTAAYNALEGGKWDEMMDARPRGLAVFDMPALPADPVLGAGSLGVAVEGRLEPVYVTSTGVVVQTPPGFITVDAASHGVLTPPMQVAEIAGRPATWTPGSDGVAYAVGAGGKAVYPFGVPADGRYTLSFEINCPTVTDDSWHIQVDDGEATVWNNLSNGGVWGWATFGTVQLRAGAHTLTVHQREDGAAMAGIRFASTATVLVEDRSQDAFALPEFNRFTRRACFLDLFNTGAGALDWQVTPADPWLTVTEDSGTLASEQRLWVSVDWAAAPAGDSLSSSLAVSHAGQSLVIPVRAWNPELPLPLTVDFVEDNGVAAIEAEHYSRRRPGTDAAWTHLPHLGAGEGAMMVSPTTAASRDDMASIKNTSPVLEYHAYLRSTGEVSVTARFIPTLPINNQRGLRYAVAIDDEAPQIVDMRRVSGTGSVWSRSVLRSAIDYTTRHPVASAGPHTLKVWMVDPGVVLDRLVLAHRELPYTYGGPPETAVAGR